MAKQHLWDQAADHVVDYIENESQAVVDMIVGDDPVPFSGPATEKQKLAYYRRFFFNPDGSENKQGQSQLMSRVGPQGFVQIWSAVRDGAEQDNVDA